MEAEMPTLYEKLGIYMPLIVVNCIVLGRALAFAYRNKVFDSVVDGFATGLGFTLSLALIGALRELIGSGKITLLGKDYIIHILPISIFTTPPGALLTIGLLLGFFNLLKRLKKQLNINGLENE